MDNVLARVLDQFPVIGPDPQFAAAEGGFSGAGVWRVAGTAGTYALRCWPKDSLPEPRILGLHSLLKHIAASAQHVAVPLESATGSTVVPGSSQLWQLEPWLPGIADFHTSPTAARLSNAMRALADWHVAADSFQPPTWASRWFSSASSKPSPAVRERLQRTENWLRGDLEAVQQIIAREKDSDFDRLATLIATNARLALPDVWRELSQAIDLRVSLQPCLRDVWHDHVLFDGDRVTGIIDPAACRSENVATDLARLLGSLVADNTRLWQHALDCYSEHRPITADEHRLIRLLDRSAVVLSPLTWLGRKYLSSVPIDEEAVLPRLRNQCDRLLVLTQSRHLS